MLSEEAAVSPSADSEELSEELPEVPSEELPLAAEEAEEVLPPHPASMAMTIARVERMDVN